MNSPFVARENELKQLHQRLQQIFDQKRQVCLIAGEAGTGKSALIYEFSNQAAQMHENLLFLVGTCNAQTGVSDPYLPFQQIIHQFLGRDNSSSSVTTANHQRLQNALKATTQAVVDIAPELTFALTPVLGTILIVGRWVMQRNDWRTRLRKTADTIAELDNTIEQSQVMFQYTELMREIAAKIPLVVVLDDLQWADEASLMLLFHLIRELENSRILFIGTYRSNETELHGHGERHSLQSILKRLKRYYGEDWIDLDHLQQTQGREFVDALVDRIPNALDESFRQNLFNLTGGHPLFTVEILEHLQRTKALIQRKNKRWIVSKKLTWDTMPAQIESVIQERIDHLAPELLELLSTASVMGQTFTAQVLAQIHQRPINQLVRELSEKLGRQYRLIHEAGEVQVPGDVLFHFSFSHSMLRQYLYSSLNEAERRLLHNEVAKSIEGLYGPDNPEAVAQLAHHYSQAGDSAQAVKYLAKSAERAIEIGAYQRSRDQIQQALTLASDNKEISENGPTQKGWLYYLSGVCNSKIGNLVQAEQDFNTSLDWLQLAEKSAFVLYPLNALGNTLRQLGRYDEGLELLNAAYEIAIEHDNKPQIVAALLGLSIFYRRTGKPNESIEIIERTIEVAQEIDDKPPIIYCYNILGIIAAQRGELDIGQAYYEKAILLSEEISNRSDYAMATNNLAGLLMHRGMYDLSIEKCQEALDISRKLGMDAEIAFKHAVMANTYYCMDQIELAKEQVDHGNSLAEHVKEHELRTFFLLLDGLLALKIDESVQAVQLLSEAQELAYRPLQNQIMAIHAIALARSGRLNKAYETAVAALDVCEDRIRDVPNYYEPRYSKGLVLAILEFLDGSPEQSYKAEIRETYEEAINMCGAAGVIQYHRLLLRELVVLDSEDKLGFIFGLLGGR